MRKRLYFLSPLVAEMYERENDTGDADDIWNGYDLVAYQEEIKKAIKEMNRVTGPNLMDYYDKDDSVKEKVQSLELTVVEQDGELKGCAVATVSEGLDRRELGLLKDYLTGQYADGWGEGFEQQGVPLESGELFVHYYQVDGFQIEVAQSVYHEEQKKTGSKPKMQLTGHDGNIFAIMGRASRLLKENGQPEAVNEMFRRVEESGSYQQALEIVSEYVETELSDSEAEVKKISNRREEKER